MSSFPWRRLVLLLACIAGGGLVGLIGQSLGGNSAGYLAIPALVLLAWVFVGDPCACLPSAERRPHDRSRSS